MNDWAEKVVEKRNRLWEWDKWMVLVAKVLFVIVAVGGHAFLLAMLRVETAELSLWRSVLMVATLNIGMGSLVFVAFWMDKRSKQQ